VLRRPVASRSPGGPRRPRTAGKLAVLGVLLLFVFGLLRVSQEPGLGISLYGLLPVVLGVFWFGLPGGLLTAAATTSAFYLDELVSPSPDFSSRDFVLGTVNRAVVFFGVAVLVTVLLRRERRMAGQLEQQRLELAEFEALRSALTPSAVPPRPGLEVATAFAPAEGELAGDFFFVVEGPGGSTTVVVGDVVGHGLEAARSAAFVRASMATFATFTSDPAELLRLADTALAERGAVASQFVTAVCLNIAPGGEVRWAAAGHPTPWFLDSARSPDGRAGAPLGVGLGGTALDVGRTALAPGEGLLVFTDGLIEGRTARRRADRRVAQFGEDRARDVVRELRGAPVGQIVTALVEAVTGFADGVLADDLCLVAVRRGTQPAHA